MDPFSIIKWIIYSPNPFLMKWALRSAKRQSVFTKNRVPRADSQQAPSNQFLEGIYFSSQHVLMEMAGGLIQPWRLGKQSFGKRLHFNPGDKGGFLQEVGNEKKVRILEGEEFRDGRDFLTLFWYLRVLRYTLASDLSEVWRVPELPLNFHW